MLDPINQKKLAILKRKARLDVVDALLKEYTAASEKYGMTRKQFAERIGMKPSQFSRILSGAQNITVEMAEVIARSMDARLSTSIVPLEDINHADSNRLARTSSGHNSFTASGGERSEKRSPLNYSVEFHL
ncbi:helix-turn-helix transcriptional regulator [Pelagibacterium sediminicola]|uniref:helix-turn-helix transcriptional regulator n=1 Tax=Pelagibacterium sediminicola TaxID=2248761 RepID=UPI000E314056|nr:helix-turn-helix transcriptional regulator [Pelagibacterium sediminicola]